MPNSFVFDANRCTGCGACRLGCTIENGLDAAASWRRVETFNPRRHPALPLYHLSLACNHCDYPACLHACPASAYERDASTGAVLIDGEKCIGCGYCSWACPYDAPVFDAERGVMTKCTFCVHRLHEGMKPACASLCPTGALDYADVPETELGDGVAGFPQTDLGPRIKIYALKPDRQRPDMLTPDSLKDANPPVASPSTISLRSEWPLAAFTGLASVLVGAVAAAALQAITVPPLAFLVGAVGAMGLGTVHLGQPLRAYRAILNVRRSWLSREIVCFIAFAAAATLYLTFWPGSTLIGALAVLLGFVALLCADRVYAVLRLSGSGHGHSASAVLTAAFLGGVFAGLPWIAAAVGLAKLIMYVRRKAQALALGRDGEPFVAVARLTLGMLVPLVLWSIDFTRWHLVIALSAVIGELIDRGEFYEELESESPALQMMVDFQAALDGARAGVQEPAKEVRSL